MVNLPRTGMPRSSRCAGRQWTLDELAVLEAAQRGLEKTGRGKRFDPIVFKAVAELELWN